MRLLAVQSLAPSLTYLLVECKMVVTNALNVGCTIEHKHSRRRQRKEKDKMRNQRGREVGMEV